MGLRNFTKYATNPGEAFSKKYCKIKNKLSMKLQVVKNKMDPEYTTKSIDMSWENKPMRYELINKSIKEMGYKKYLEIGCFRDDCFSRIVCDNKVGVDPASGGTMRMTSDEFFAQNKEKFDFVFIDGLHTYEQVIVDIKNSLEVLNEGGTIMMHDCLPRMFEHQTVPPTNTIWNGDTWKAFVEARTFDNADAAVCLIDHGVGMIKKRTNKDKLVLNNVSNFKKLKFSDLVDNYKTWLRTTEFDKAMDFVRD